MGRGSRESKPLVQYIRNIMSLTNHREQLEVARGEVYWKCWPGAGHVTCLEIQELGSV